MGDPRLESNLTLKALKRIVGSEEGLWGLIRSMAYTALTL